MKTIIITPQRWIQIVVFTAMALLGGAFGGWLFLLITK